MDELDAFGEDESEARVGESRDAEVSLLLITQGGLTLGLEARVVEAVVPWQSPSPLPQTSACVWGVVQDRGRLVAVRRPEQATQQLARLVLCRTSRGLIGVPASETLSIGPVRLNGPLRYGEPLAAGDRGVITILDIEALVTQMTEGERRDPRA